MLVKEENFSLEKIKSSADIPIPKRLIDQVIGQDKAVELVKRAAKQKRHILLIGPPGTGKSLLARAMAEILEQEYVEDILVYENPQNETEPNVLVVPSYPDYDYLMKHPAYIPLYTPQELKIIQEYTAKKKVKELPKVLKKTLGRRIIESQMRFKVQKKAIPSSFIPLVLTFLILGILLPIPESIKWMIIASTIGFGIIYLIYNAFFSTGARRFSPFPKYKLIVENKEGKARFVDATATKAGALLGDVKHDPFQTGGLGTPPHIRVEAGAIHKAHKGVLFIDEIASLPLQWQQQLLTAMQEKEFSITGQSETSSGALVKTKPVPCDFILVAAGNLEDIKKLHPALRDRIRGYGYEVYMEEDMPDNEENRKKFFRFIAQEVKKDEKIPHFTKEAMFLLLEEAKKRSERKGRITLKLRDIGGIIRAAGDIAKEKGKTLVEEEDVRKAIEQHQSIESQVVKKYVELKKEYSVVKNEGEEVGRVNGLAVVGETAGLVLPILTDISPSLTKEGGKIIATGKLGEIAKESIQNLSNIIKKVIGEKLRGKDIHIQFLQTYEGVEGDSASLAVVLSLISSVTKIPIRQDFAITGSVDIRGNVLPVGGVTRKVEAAIEAGIKNVILPEANLKDVYLFSKEKKKIKLHPVKNIIEAIKLAFAETKEKKALLRKLKAALK